MFLEQVPIPNRFDAEDMNYACLLVAYKTKRPKPVEFDLDGVPVLIEAILKARRKEGTLEFLVKWTGYDDLENFWQPLRDVANAWNLVLDFYRRKPGVAKPTKGSF
jgi:hypothetical protein